MNVSDKPKRMNVNIERIPLELREQRKWVLWRWVFRDGKWTKPPYQPDGKPSDSTDPATWTDFESALSAYRNGGRFDGIGFSLEGGNYAGVDWDDCVIDGNINPQVLQHVKGMDSYTERSPSHNGLKTLLRGKLPDKGRHKKFKDIELGVFDRGRYFCITGNVIPDVSTSIEDRQPQLDTLVRRYWPNDFKPKQTTPTTSRIPLSLSDTDLIEKACNAADGGKFRRLWSGDISEYDNDDSRADLALCCKLAFWTGKDAGRIDHLFQQSGLMREKWDRDDYRHRTIERAIEQTSEVYDPQRTAPTCRTRSPDRRPVNAHYNRTDTGNGQRFADQHRGNVKYCYLTNKWLAWDGKRWKPDNEGIVRQLAKKTTRSIYLEAANESDSDKSEKLGKHAAASESSFRQEAMLKLAQSEAGIPILPEQMDLNPWLLNVLNGTVNLKTGELLSHRKGDLITKIVNANYDPEALCPKWMDFLETVMGGDAEMVNYLCRVAGYTLTGDAGEQCLFVLHGNGENGKSTYLNVPQSILEDYSLQTSFDTFTVKKNEGVRNDIARMRTARMVVAIETGDGKRLDEQVVKQLTGGDKVTARFLHQEFFEYRPQFKVFLAANHKPTIYGQDHAIWRRIRLIPFNVKIPPEKRINNFERVMLEEKEGILNWMIFGCQEWQRMGLADPEKVKMATEQYRSEMDVLEDFIESCCKIGNCLKAKHGGLYAAYEKWCEGAKETPFKTRTFAKMLESRGFTYTKPGNAKTWQGIGLKA